MHLRVERRTTKSQGPTLRFRAVESCRKNGRPSWTPVTFITSVSERLITEYESSVDLKERVRAAEALCRFWAKARTKVKCKSNLSWEMIASSINKKVPCVKQSDVDNLEEIHRTACNWLSKGLHEYEAHVSSFRSRIDQAITRSFQSARAANRQLLYEEYRTRVYSLYQIDDVTVHLITNHISHYWKLRKMPKP